MIVVLLWIQDAQKALMYLKCRARKRLQHNMYVDHISRQKLQIISSTYQPSLLSRCELEITNTFSFLNIVPSLPPFMLILQWVSIYSQNSSRSFSSLQPFTHLFALFPPWPQEPTLGGALPSLCTSSVAPGSQRTCQVKHWLWPTALSWDVSS